MAEQEPSITLNDIGAAVQIIDLASARGAIRGEEMAAVGNVRQRLAAFLEYSEKQARAAAEKEAEAGEAEDVPTTS